MKGNHVMRVLVALGVMALVAACGVDGEPVAPTMNTTIGIGTHGVQGGGSVNSGPVTGSVGNWF
jgi:hypothetical protein